GQDAGPQFPGADRLRAGRGRNRVPHTEGLHLFRHGLLRHGRDAEPAHPRKRRARSIAPAVPVPGAGHDCDSPGGSAMIRRYVADQGRLRPITESAGPVTDGVWFDVFAPTPEEEAMLEQAVHVNIPNRADMEEIEISSRLYYEGDAAFMTAVLPARSEADAPEMAPVTFILADGLL